MNELLSEQFRPKTFEEMMLPENLKIRFQNMFDKRQVMNMLLYGKPGAGKTSVARIFCNKDYFDVIEINGSLHTSIEEVRNKIIGFSTSMSLYSHPKICFIDEADYLSKNAQASLRGVIEQSSRTCRFIFTANELSKIHSALSSRLIPICFDLTSTQTAEALGTYTQKVIEKMKSISPNANEDRIKTIIHLHYPDYRTISNFLEFEFS